VSDEGVTFVDQLTVALDHLDKVLMADISSEIDPKHAREIRLAYDTICIVRQDIVEWSKKFEKLSELLQRF
jgi:hypothetical protein